MNIVRINEVVFAAMDAAESCGLRWHFTYARQDYSNLAKPPQVQAPDPEAGTEQVHAFMQTFSTNEGYNVDDGLLERTTHRYTLRLLLDSLFDIQMFNELKPDEQKSKFKLYVEPMLDCFPAKYNAEVCKLGYMVRQLTIGAEYNIFDQNKDGLRVDVVIVEE